jgi:hypothetical protein
MSYCAQQLKVVELEVEELKFDTHCIGLAVRQASLMCYAFHDCMISRLCQRSQYIFQQAFLAVIQAYRIHKFSISSHPRHPAHDLRYYKPPNMPPIVRYGSSKFPSLPNPTVGVEYYYSSPSPHHRYQAAAMSFQAVLDSHPHPPPALVVW